MWASQLSCELTAQRGQEAAAALSDPGEAAGLDVVVSLALDDEDEAPLSLEPWSSAWRSLTGAEDFPRLSVTYQPLPLKTIGGAWRTRLAVPLPHSWQTCVVSAEKLSRRS